MAKDQHKYAAHLNSIYLPLQQNLKLLSKSQCMALLVHGGHLLHTSILLGIQHIEAWFPYNCSSWLLVSDHLVIYPDFISFISLSNSLGRVAPQERSWFSRDPPLKLQ